MAKKYSRGFKIMGVSLVSAIVLLAAGYIGVPKLMEFIKSKKQA